VNSQVTGQWSHIPPLFIEGKPGYGKTFVLDAVACTLRSQRLIVLIVGSSALAATLYKEGRTAHNLFQIPVKDVC
jgi:chromosomal replication initiation ATPase DnaA